MFRSSSSSIAFKMLSTQLRRTDAKNDKFRTMGPSSTRLPSMVSRSRCPVYRCRFGGLVRTSMMPPIARP